MGSEYSPLQDVNKNAYEQEVGQVGNRYNDCIVWFKIDKLEGS